MFPQLTTDVQAGEVLVEMNTTLGAVKIKLFPEFAPKTVENFLGHAKSGYYNGIIFHRVIQDFMIQGGDPTGTGMGGESIWGDSFEDEFSDKLFNLRGALSMANAGPNTNGSQFFIVQMKHLPSDMLRQLQGAGFPEEIIEAYAQNGGTPWLDHKHTVFGHIVEGMDIVDKIADVEKDSRDKPLEDVKIESITVFE
ncbi:peptidylprolyl isomerase [Lysinibacillus fusiformis]|uniref:peptidylprolyl isomerase n=1 Tax=Lysinibacillus fusiformis TaxID=28031 RepID=UPI00119F2B9A|nr:peptidylprolyl isomerase [Lysinibacillus fusiformis]